MERPFPHPQNQQDDDDDNNNHFGYRHGTPPPLTTPPLRTKPPSRPPKGLPSSWSQNDDDDDGNNNHNNNDDDDYRDNNDIDDNDDFDDIHRINNDKNDMDDIIVNVDEDRNSDNKDKSDYRTQATFIETDCNIDTTTTTIITTTMVGNRKENSYDTNDIKNDDNNGNNNDINGNNDNNEDNNNDDDDDNNNGNNENNSNNKGNHHNKHKDYNNVEDSKVAAVENNNNTIPGAFHWTHATRTLTQQTTTTTTTATIDETTMNALDDENFHLEMVKLAQAETQGLTALGLDSRGESVNGEEEDSFRPFVGRISVSSTNSTSANPTAATGAATGYDFSDFVCKSFGSMDTAGSSMEFTTPPSPLPLPPAMAPAEGTGSWSTSTSASAGRRQRRIRGGRRQERIGGRGSEQHQEQEQEQGQGGSGSLKRFPRRSWTLTGSEGGGNDNNYDNSSFMSHTSNHRRISNQSNLAVAVCIEEEELENDIREKIIQSSVHADVVNVADEEEKTRQIQKKWINFVVSVGIVALTIALAIGLGIGFYVRNKIPGHVNSSYANNNNNSNTDDAFTSTPTMVPTAMPIPTLERITSEGILRCGVRLLSRFTESFGRETGADSQYCHAIAAAIFGNSSQVELIVVLPTDRFESLASGVVDVLSAGVTVNMERDVYFSRTEMGFTFSKPYLYEGLRFAGKPEYVACVDNDLKNFFECENIKVCVVAATSHLDILLRRLPPRQIQIVPDVEKMYANFINGECNLLASETIFISEPSLRTMGYTGPYQMGKVYYSREPIALVTRDDDPEWSDFVHVIFNTLLLAEKRNIRQQMAGIKLPTTHVFGREYQEMFKHTVQAVGNYADIYERFLSHALPRSTMNFINKGTTGLIYSFPLGNNANDPNFVGPGPTEGGTIQTIRNRMTLRCAIRLNRPGFAEEVVVHHDDVLEESATNTTHTTGTTVQLYEGIDVDFCTAIAASLRTEAVDGVVSVEFVPIPDQAAGYQLLSTGDVDIVAGFIYTWQDDVHEPTTGKGYTFSQPYFYGPDSGVIQEREASMLTTNMSGSSSSSMNDDDDFTLCLLTNQEDPQWASYVFWLINAIFYAEEQDITQRKSNDMPLIYLFGLDFIRMYRDAILSVGNYGDIYTRNLSFLFPRQGTRNEINFPLHPGPQHHPYGFSS